MSEMKVKKRSGKTEKFHRHKLLKSVHISMHRTGIDNARLEEKITDEIIKHLKGKRKKTVDTEDVRAAVCTILKRNKHHEVCDFYSLVWLHAKKVSIKNVIKRDGRKQKFSPEKIFKSVQKSFKAAGIKDGKTLENAMHNILGALDRRFKNKEPTTEEIREIVDYVLIKKTLPNVAKHYIMHRYF